MILTILKFGTFFLAGVVSGCFIMLYRVAYLHRKVTGRSLADEIKEIK